MPAVPADNSFCTCTATYTIGLSRLRTLRKVGSFLFAAVPADNSFCTCTATHTTGHARLRTLRKVGSFLFGGSAGGQFVLYLYNDAHHRTHSTPDPEGDGVFVVSVGRLALKPPHCGQAFCGKKWAAHRPPNINSITQSEGNVNRECVWCEEICSLHKYEMVKLYNIAT